MIRNLYYRDFATDTSTSLSRSHPFLELTGLVAIADIYACFKSSPTVNTGKVV